MTLPDTDQAEARARVEAVLERLRRVDLQVVVVVPPDATRLAARRRARAAADAAGRLVLFDEASTAAREATLRAFAQSGFSGTWAATEMSASVASAHDRVAAAAAFEEAAMAAVVEDLADDETLEVLRATSNELDRATGIPPPGSLATFTARPSLVPQSPLAVAVAVPVALVALSAVAWATIGLGAGLLVFALGAAAVAWLARRRTSRDA